MWKRPFRKPSGTGKPLADYTLLRKAELREFRRQHSACIMLPHAHVRWGWLDDRNAFFVELNTAVLSRTRWPKDLAAKANLTALCRRATRQSVSFAVAAMARDQPQLAKLKPVTIERAKPRPLTIHYALSGLQAAVSGITLIAVRPPGSRTIEDDNLQEGLHGHRDGACDPLAGYTFSKALGREMWRGGYIDGPDAGIKFAYRQTAGPHPKLVIEYQLNKGLE
jgi:hypothetical protein